MFKIWPYQQRQEFIAAISPVVANAERFPFNVMLIDLAQRLEDFKTPDYEPLLVSFDNQGQIEGACLRTNQDRGLILSDLPQQYFSALAQIIREQQPPMLHGLDSTFAKLKDHSSLLDDHQSYHFKMTYYQLAKANFVFADQAKFRPALPTDADIFTLHSGNIGKFQKQSQNGQSPSSEKHLRTSFERPPLRLADIC